MLLLLGGCGYALAEGRAMLFFMLISMLMPYFLPLFASRGKGVLARSVRVERALPQKILWFVLYFLLISAFFLRLPELSNVVSALASGGFLSHALEGAASRYSGEVTAGGRFVLGTTLLFCASFFAPIIEFKFKRHTVLIGFIFLSQILVEISTLARTGFLLSLTALATSYLYFRPSHINQKSTADLIQMIAVAFFLVSLVFIVIQYLRVYDHPEALDVVSGKYIHYLTSPFAALAGFIDRGWEATYGFSSYAGVIKPYGFDVDQGFYSRFYFRDGTSTNIYLALRGLLSDLGVIGTSIYFFIFGAVLKSGVVYKGFFGFALYFFIAPVVLFIPYSPFIFTSFTYATILFIFIFTLLRLLAKSMRKDRGAHRVIFHKINE